MNNIKHNDIINNSNFKRISFRKDKLSSEINKVFFYLWTYKIKNPVLRTYSPYMAEVSHGCEYVKFILFEPNLTEDLEKNEKLKLKRTLKSAERWFRCQLGKLIQLRKVPEIKFHTIPRFSTIV